MRKILILVLSALIINGCASNSIVEKQVESQAAIVTESVDKSIDNIAPIELINPQTNGKVWVYLPENYQNGNVPVILVPPAGTRIIHGMELSDGDTPEHLPYVKAGFAVISFELSGHLPNFETASDDSISNAISDFIARNGGLDDAKDALTIATQKYSNLNINEVYIAGHSSAGTIALMAAKKIPEIKGVMAYAPVLDIRHYLGVAASSNLSIFIYNFESVLLNNSPNKNIDNYRVPIFLFVSQDDDVIVEQMTAYSHFVDELNMRNMNLTYKQVNTGGHYYSMLNEGIPSAIEWLQELRNKK